MIFAILALSYLSVSAVVSQAPQPTECPSMSTAPNLDTTKLLGVWYEQSKFLGPNEKNVNKCSTSTYSPNGNDLTLKRSAINSETNAIVELSANLRRPDPVGSPSKFKILFPTLQTVPEANYWIVATDYTSYNIVYSCNKINGVIRTRAWFKTRARQPSDEVVKSAMDIAKSHGIDTSLLVKTDHGNCAN